MRPDIYVVPGSVAVSSVDVAHESPGCLIISCDCATKRPEIVGYDGLTCLLAPGPRTTGTLGESDHPTEIHVDGISGDEWSVFAEVARYTLMIAVWKRGNWRRVW